MSSGLGPYEIRGELGRGAMAVVWRAWDPKLEREVAVKEPVIPAGVDASTTSELAARFVREGRAAAGLNHPGIVTIFAADIYDGRPAIVMELIEGETLGSVLSRGPLSLPASLSILDQLLDAVAYAHSKGVVHRDIKPDNVFVTTDGRVKLADFGIAHLTASGTMTQAGTVMGTPGYMAPEQIRGEPVDARADLFAVGVILHEMLSGSNPFVVAGAHPAATMYKVLNESLPDIRASLSDAPESVAVSIAIATAKDPASRFVSAAAMARGLAGEGSLSAPVAPGKPSRGPQVLIAAVVGMGIVVLIVLVSLAQQAPRPAAVVMPPEPTTAATPAKVEEQPGAESDQQKAAGEFGDEITVWRPGWTPSSAAPKFEYGRASGGPFYSYCWDGVGATFTATMKDGAFGTSEILAETISAVLDEVDGDFVPTRMGDKWVYPSYGSGVSHFIFLDPENVDSRGVPNGSGLPYYIYSTSNPDEAESFISAVEPIVVTTDDSASDVEVEAPTLSADQDAGSSGGSPMEAVREYYAACDAHDLDRAWSLFSSGYKRRTGFGKYNAIFDNLSGADIVSLSEDEMDGDQALVAVEVRVTTTSGASELWGGMVELQRESGSWTIERLKLGRR